ncbi:unnamed protein product [Moneuplotes crassus]|uniref:Uncharacterized protein n=1 Tax=Euplotes crassus TaxID=5936 RepID=A0AAD1UM89_EUPCR|nr:unnamed protein product [Moneuplotes crassus]
MDPSTRSYESPPAALSPKHKPEKSSRNNKVDLVITDDRVFKVNPKTTKPKKSIDRKRNFKDSIEEPTEYVRLPVISKGRSDKGLLMKRKRNNTQVRKSYNDQIREKSSYSYTDETQSSIVPRSTGILETINEEWNKEKKKSILDIFEKNYDLPSLQLFKNRKYKIERKRAYKCKYNPLKRLESLSTDDNVLSLQGKIKTIPHKQRKNKVSSLIYNQNTPSYRYKNHSMSHRDPATMFSNSDNLSHSSRYDPKKDRYKLINWIKNKRNRSKDMENIKNDSIFAKYSVGSKTNVDSHPRNFRHLEGQLSYSNIATILSSEGGKKMKIKV